MRFIDRIIQNIREDPHISLVHKQVLINRIQQRPTQEELIEATKVVEKELNAKAYEPPVP